MSMNIQVLSDEKKPLFKRREMIAKLGYEDKTPSRLEIRKQLAKKLGAKEELIIVKRIKPDYGTPAAELEINIYDDEKSLKELEAEYMVERHLPKEKKEKKEEPKEEEKPAEKPPAEAEKKPEAKGEKRPEVKEEKKEEKPEKKKDQTPPEGSK